MKMLQTTFNYFILAILPFLVKGESCLSAKATSKVYTTTEASLSAHTVFIIDFDLKCSNNPKELNVYAELEGRTVLATKTGPDSYQVSFSDEHKSLPSKNYEVSFYDDEAYTDLRKHQRNNEDTSSVKTLFKVDVNHPGASKGPWFQSEFVAAATAFFVVYMAHRSRGKLQA